MHQVRLWTYGLVRETHVGGIEAGIGVRVRSGKAEQFVLGRDSRAVPANLDLLTGGVKLGFTLRGCQMEGDDLVPNQVLSWSEIVGKSSIKNGPIHFIWA